MKKLFISLFTLLLTFTCLSFNTNLVQAEDTTDDLSHIIYDIKTVNTLYGVGEKNLTDDDVVTINNVDYYVLQIVDNKAELITKDIYDARFDDVGDTSLDYTRTTLYTWMNNFYTSKLKDSVVDSYLVDSTVIAYSNPTYADSGYDFETGSKTATSQYVFALDAKEAQTNKKQFYWDNSNTNLKKLDGSQASEHANGFWTTANTSSTSVDYLGLTVFAGGSVGSIKTTDKQFGARPCFWINLYDVVVTYTTKDGNLNYICENDINKAIEKLENINFENVNTNKNIYIDVYEDATCTKDIELDFGKYNDSINLSIEAEVNDYYELSHNIISKISNLNIRDFNVDGTLTTADESYLFLESDVKNIVTGNKTVTTLFGDYETVKIGEETILYIYNSDIKDEITTVNDYKVLNINDIYYSINEEELNKYEVVEYDANKDLDLIELDYSSITMNNMFKYHMMANYYGKDFINENGIVISNKCLYSNSGSAYQDLYLDGKVKTGNYLCSAIAEALDIDASELTDKQALSYIAEKEDTKVYFLRLKPSDEDIITPDTSVR